MFTSILQSWSSRQPDPLLRSFLQARDESSAKRALDHLLTQHIQPLMQKIIGHKIGIHFDHQGNVRQTTSRALDVQDLLNDVQAAVIERLWNQRQNQNTEPIAGLENYVAMAAHRVCSTYLRRKKPKWSQLKSALRYLLEHQAGFDEWRTRSGAQVAGFSAWKARQADTTTSKRLVTLLLDPRDALKNDLPLHRIHGKPTADVLEAIFNVLGHPLETDDLVNVCAALYQIQDVETSSSSATEDSDAILERVRAPGQALADQVESQEFLHWIWQEIQSSPPAHRQCLLLNFRDGSGKGILSLLVILGVATFGQIAVCLEMSVEELAKIWNDLPWDDLQIGAMLGMTREQIIGCRKNCRKRLERRTTHYDQ